MAQQKAIQDILLSNVSSGYFPTGFISEDVLPVIRSKEKTGKLGKYGTAHLRVESTIIGGEGRYPRVKVQSRSTDSYSVEGHGLEGQVTEDDYSNVQQPFDAEKDEVLGLSTTLAVGKEKALGDTLGDTAILTQNTTLVGASQFNDSLNSNPLSVFNTAHLAIKDGCGEVANVAIIPWRVYQKGLKYHPQLLDALGYKDNRPGGIKENELADIFGVERIYIPKASYESAKEGQSSSLAEIWGRNIVFAVLPKTAQKYQVSLGYLVNLLGRDKRRVFKYPTQNPPNGKSILVDDHYDMFISNVGAGYLIKDAIAA